jgi:glycosyltransferase involved in cell wall biosynthesis
MKVALLGNMNNNNFTMMRYFRDLGVDAHLLCFSNDGAGTLEHFKPENDTWQIEKWRPFIHKLDIDNASTAIFGAPRKIQLPPTRKHLRKLFQGYDFFIGSGITPAILGRIDLRLDIFYPYATGVEHVGTHELMSSMRRSFVRRVWLEGIRRRQMKGIQQAKVCINAEMSVTDDVLNSIGVKAVRYPIPMVYTGDDELDIEVPQRLVAPLLRISDSEFTVFSHARLLWMRDSLLTEEEWQSASKHNDWLVEGFAGFCAKKPETKACLVLVEYGPDVAATKRLCSQLSINDKILWLPKMSRKELLVLLKTCDLGVGEFYIDQGAIWGGTGWEVLACGKPLLQSVNFSSAEFIDHFGYELPPILDVKSSLDVEKHLLSLFVDKVKRKSIGRASRQWFDSHNGIELAKKWLRLIV